MIIKESVCNKELVHVRVLFRKLGIRVTLQILISAAKICLYHARPLLKLLQTFFIVFQRTAHTPQSPCYVYASVLTVIQRVELYSTFLNELQLILITPFKDRIDGVDMVLLVAVYPALGRF